MFKWIIRVIEVYSQPLLTQESLLTEGTGECFSLDPVRT